VKLEESHEKLLGTHEDLLISHDGLKLAHEAMVTKVKSCESHVDISTSSTRNALLPCASPCNSSLHDIGTSCDELLTMPCCSNNEVSTSSSTFVDTNLVEENKELKSQVTILKKDLEKCHEGNSTLKNILSGQKSPHDKGGLGFISNNKKSKNKKKGQDQVKYYLLQVQECWTPCEILSIEEEGFKCEASREVASSSISRSTST
jgi:hypothetical protein